MVTPYTNKLFNRLNDFGLQINIISCTQLEKNRTWSSFGDKKYSQKILRGISLRLSPSRFAHINVGTFGAIRKTKPSIVIITGFYPTMLVAFLWAILNRKPVGLMIDGWKLTMPDSMYHRAARSVVLAKVAFVIVPGKKGAEYFAGHGLSNKTHIIPLVPAWTWDQKATPYNARDYDLVWCAHINDEVKNFSTFENIVRAVKNRIGKARILIIGDGPECEQRINKLREDLISIDHKKSVPWNTVGKYFSTAKMLILPSKWEPWGLVCNEAMQCGTPCAVSNHVGAAHDLVEHNKNGLIFDLEADAQIWAERIAELITNEATWIKFSEKSIAESKKRNLTASSSALAKILSCHKD